MKTMSPKVRAAYNYQCEQALDKYWQASDGLADFLEMLEKDAELFAYFLEAYGKEAD